MTHLIDISTESLLAELNARRDALRGELLRLELALDGAPLTCTQTAARLIPSAAEIWGVTPASIIGSSRQVRTAEARMAVCFLLRTCYRHSSPEIGAALHRDHSTILHACKRQSDGNPTSGGNR